MKQLTVVLIILFFLNPVLASDVEMTIDELKEQLQNIQSISDNDKNHAKAIADFKNLKNCIKQFNLPDEYKRGIDYSILSIANNKLNSSELTVKQIAELAKKNENFIAIEKNKNIKGVDVILWREGYTQCEVDLHFNFKIELDKEQDINKKMEIIKKYALKLCPYEFGYLKISSSGMSYGDEVIHALYFNKDYSDEIKLKTLLELKDKLKGSAKGNAYLCLAYLYKKLNDKSLKNKNAIKGAEILQEIIMKSTRSYYRTMYRKCVELIN